MGSKVDINTEVVLKYEELSSISKTARYFSTSEQKIRKILVDNDVELNNPFASNRPTKEILKEYLDQGLFFADIARKYDTNVNTITRWVKSYNLHYHREDIPDKICELYSQGLTPKEIAEKVGRAKCNVCRILRKHNIHSVDKRTEWDKPTEEVLKRLIDQGLSSQTISDMYGVVRQSIRKLIEEYNLPKFTLKKLDDKQEEIIRLYKEGKAVNQIAEKYNVYSLCIRRILEENNIQYEKPEPWQKGLTKETSPKLRLLAEKSLKTRKEGFASGRLQAWNKGKECQSISEGVKRYYKEHPELGKIISEHRKEWHKNHPGYFKNRIVSQETREKLSLAMKGNKKLIAHLNRIRKLVKRKDTSIEIAVKRELLYRGYTTFVANEDLFNHNFDIIFPIHKLVVECEGCWFHGCEKCYPNRIQDIPVKFNRDKLKIKTLKEQGWKLIRLWEHDIKKDVKSCVDRIEKELIKGDENK